ncbi:glycosyltransferase [Bradyrhizobium sp. 139]|uniref:glycosyltransferase family 2 protein n=1 Tax=Bradyrhizobium sp. 139 TaxID=2782616 RepID=UPI001FF8AB53|nr:glycosyltransferase family 2 protein [Bradyrhizobium sp. 139]MCK1744304.1 glycosyltransferase [Bradyrhizobium sp. 139]
MQAIIGWGFRHGLVPDEVPETDPFKNLRVEGTRSTRDAFDPHGLQAVFDAALFTEHAIPEAGKGATAVWLPLLAVFMGARQNELASLRVSDIREDAETDTSLMSIAREAAAGKRVKSDAGERVVPLHPQIIQLGFLEYVAQRNTEEGENAWLFPAVAPDQRGGRKAWAKWWGRYRQFFTVGMKLRHTRNAILLHGTMCLVSRHALERVGGWAEWCLTEDSELGLRLLARGYTGLYVPRTMGGGLLPLSYRSYRRQRRRCAIGGVQTLRRHWRILLGLSGIVRKRTYSPSAPPAGCEGIRPGGGGSAASR